MARKLGGRGVISAVRPGRLFYITDSVSSRLYLVDTGSAFSIMPWESSDPPSGPSLTAADGRQIPCRGGAVLHSHHRRRGSMLGLPIGCGEFSYHRYRFFAPSRSSRGRGEPSPAARRAGGGGLRHHWRAFTFSAPLLRRGNERPSSSFGDSSYTFSDFFLFIGRCFGGSAGLAARFGLVGSSPSPFSGSFHRHFGGFRGPSTSWGATLHHYRWPAIHRQISPPGPLQASGGQGGISNHFGRGDYLPLLQPVEQPPSHGEEEGRLMAAVR